MNQRRSAHLLKMMAKILGPMLVALFVIAGCNTVAPPCAYPPDYYMVTTIAQYRPVNTPGTQRRVAQTDAETKAREDLLNYVGSMPAGRGRTVNDVMMRDNRIRAAVLEAIRTAEVVDWQVKPCPGTVQVWVRLDLNRIRAIVAQCG